VIVAYRNSASSRFSAASASALSLASAAAFAAAGSRNAVARQIRQMLRERILGLNGQLISVHDEQCAGCPIRFDWVASRGHHADIGGIWPGSVRMSDDRAEYNRLRAQLARWRPP
jgi:hypothetical protein